MAEIDRANEISHARPTARTSRYTSYGTGPTLQTRTLLPQRATCYGIEESRTQGLLTSGSPAHTLSRLDRSTMTWSFVFE